jgi:putative flippase GtrA
MSRRSSVPSTRPFGSVSRASLAGVVGLAPGNGSRQVLSQFLRYGVAGLTSTLVYVTLTLLLSGPVGLPIQLGIAIGYLCAIVVNFLLQRHFVFRHAGDFALSTRHQAGYYVLVGAVVVGGSAAATTWLPDVLGTSARLVYFGTVLVTPLFTYTVFRLRAFHSA